MSPPQDTSDHMRSHNGESLRDLLAHALHQPCIERWAELDDDTYLTKHGPETHQETATRLLPVFASYLARLVEETLR